MPSYGSPGRLSDAKQHLNVGLFPVRAPIILALTWNGKLSSSLWPELAANYSRRTLRSLAQEYGMPHKLSMQLGIAAQAIKGTDLLARTPSGAYCKEFESATPRGNEMLCNIYKLASTQYPLLLYRPSNGIPNSCLRCAKNFVNSIRSIRFEYSPENMGYPMKH